MIKPTAPLYHFLSGITLVLYSSWWKTFQLAYKKPVRYQLPLGIEFNVWNLMDIWTLREVFLDGYYELIRKIPKGATVLDVGGSIGDFSVFAQKLRHAKVVHSFEPDSNRIMLFKQNQQLNNCHRGKLHEVAVMSLAEIFRLTKIDHCEFMKVDCEGAEYDIFIKAAPALLKKIDHIVFEVHWFTPKMKDQYAQLRTVLTDNHFSLVEKANPVHNTIGFLYATQSSTH